MTDTICVKICDDDEMVIERLREMILRILKKYGYHCICRTYASGLAFLDEMEEEADLIFLDVEMPEISGFDIAQKLVEQQKNKKLVFITGHDNCVFPALDYYPFSYLRKSRMKEEKVEEVICQFLNQKTKTEKVFRITAGSKSLVMPLLEIARITHWNHQITIHCADGTEEHVRGSIKKCEEQLDATWFFKANSGTIINLKYYRRFDGICFWRNEKESITVTRARRKEAKERFLKVWREQG